jgi:hypothetical protein
MANRQRQNRGTNDTENLLYAIGSGFPFSTIFDKTQENFFSSALLAQAAHAITLPECWR